MKKIVILLTVFIGACSLVAPEAKLLYTDANKLPVYSVKCGNSYGIEYCYKKANQTCPSGFNVIDKSENSYTDTYNGEIYTGVHRSLIFQCK